VRVNERSFEIKRRAILRVQARIGLRCGYTRADYRADERALQESVARKRRRRDQEEAAFIELHGEAAWFREFEQERVQRIGGRKREAVA
jgi:hypothetical protein